ncbi:hypothetical protein GGD83_001994 [Rhodoblastus sphagnicola]|uniref:hypothetical protein n=1 Tax=Rhodoblastus sphagnicola TaxID=333368 RepID=UPI0011B0091B|nr:hypothetical protein [Rhodoblastus sphagnicola]MBB4198201.1 hypothetical protein [Rhodoblastus sphagnicola]
MAAYVILATGNDTLHHVLRIDALAQQIATGSPSPLIENKATGEVAAIFLYYSFLPYLLPVALTVAGVASRVSLQIAEVVYLGLLIYSLRRLVECLPRPEKKQLAYAAAILFLTANYVYSDWTTRAAIGEICAYALIPMAIVYALEETSREGMSCEGRSCEGSSWIKLAFIFFLQACAHPIVFAFCALGTFVSVYAITDRPLLKLARPLLTASVAGLAAAAPFWLPAALFMNDVLGKQALPFNFANTFAPPWQVLDPTIFATVGPTMIAFCGYLVYAGWANRDRRLLSCSILFFALLLMQTWLFAGLIPKIPGLSQIQFIWRLMFATAVIGFAAALRFSQRDHCGNFARLIPVFAIVAVSAFGVRLMTKLPKIVNDVQKIISPSDRTAESYFVNFSDEPESVWGVRLFSPDYANIRSFCPESTPDVFSRVSFADLRKNPVVSTPYVGVFAGPIDFVTYRAKGENAVLSHCDHVLVLGPLTPGATLSVDESKLDLAQKSRAGVLGFAALIFAAQFMRRRKKGIAGAVKGNAPA